MERPSGPLGAATQSSRPMVGVGNPRPEFPGPPRRVPMPPQVPPTSSLVIQQAPITGAQFLVLAEDAMKVALDEHNEKEKAARAGGLPLPGVTLDLSHKRIQIFPEEVVDILKTELERLALSHNQITTFPLRFSECTSLRYLNVRNNLIREFPESFLELKSLEILDLARNKLSSLPQQLYKLTSLKVLSVQKNRLETLPVCIADMTTLQVLKLGNNPLRFPAKELLKLPSQTSSNGTNQDNDDKGNDKGNDQDMAITLLAKKLLRESQKPTAVRIETESTGDESSEGGTETPRPVKRVMSGRFPIKVNGTDMSDLRSPAFPPRPPPIPSRSHHRGVSNQSTGRSGAQPLAMSNTNERVRSNSEGLVSTPETRDPNTKGGAFDRERAAEKSRRNGIVSRKAHELGTVDEMKANNRYSHYRGLSHGSAMQGNMSGNTRSPASPADSVPQRATYVKRLSSLPERKRESQSADPVVEAAKSILYALYQVHPLIQNLLGVARDGTNKRTSLERVFYNANTHVEELDKHIQNYDAYTEEDEEASPLSNETVHNTCITCVGAYVHVCHLLQENVQSLLNNGDPRYIRSLLLNVYGSIAEIRNASDAFIRAHQAVTMDHPNVVVQSGRATANTQLRPIVLRHAGMAADDTLRAQPRDRSYTQAQEQPTSTPRYRSGTVVQQSNLRVATGPIPPQFAPLSDRSGTFTGASQNGLYSGVFNPSASATPRSGESFASTASGNRANGGDFTEEDKMFEQFFLMTQETTDLALRILPLLHTQFRVGLQINNEEKREIANEANFNQLIARAADSYRVAGELKSRLSEIKLKEPGVRTHASFWRLCKAFVHSYYELANDIKQASRVTVMVGVEVIELIRPLQKSVKAMALSLGNSPWAYLASEPQPNASFNAQTTQVPLPMTPQSAALGPAVQATVPSTPLSASFSSVSNNSSFERSDTFASTNSSVSSSRNGTMLNPSDGSMTPSSLQSPANSFGPRYGNGFYRDGPMNGYGNNASNGNGHNNSHNNGYLNGGGRPSF